MSEYHARHELSWLMELTDTHKVIGEIVLYDFHLQKQADIGYRINKEYWGKGFAPEAGQAMVKVAFELLNLNRLQLRCFANNLGSIRVAEKLLFIREGLIRQGVIINVTTDYYIYGMLKSDYANQPISDSIVQIRKE
jgi:ribosomal-protein-alanine N-acetyltransferase